MGCEGGGGESSASLPSTDASAWGEVGGRIKSTLEDEEIEEEGGEAMAGDKGEPMAAARVGAGGGGGGAVRAEESMRATN